MCLCVIRREFDSRSQFSLGAIQPTFTTDRHSKIIMRTRALGFQKHCMAQGSEGGIEVIPFILHHPEGKPGTGEVRIHADGFLQKPGSFIQILLAIFQHSEICKRRAVVGLGG